MGHIFSVNKAKSAIDMSRYGIGTVVLTEHEGLEEMMREYASKPDEIWCEGRGKKYFHKMLRKQLLKEDKYFDENPNAIQRNSQRWANFMDDCVIYATLSSYLFDEPLYLVHPQSYEKAIATAPLNATSGELPTFIEDVFVLQ
jgi:hypothetical protein